MIDRVRRVPMVELPIGATVDGVLGSVDLERTASVGRRALRAGLLARAHHGLRADLAIFRAAVARAAFEGRAEVTVDDIREAAHLALPHRRRSYASAATKASMQRLDEVVSRVLAG